MRHSSSAALRLFFFSDRSRIEIALHVALPFVSQDAESISRGNVETWICAVLSQGGTCKDWRRVAQHGLVRLRESGRWDGKWNGAVFTRDRDMRAMRVCGAWGSGQLDETEVRNGLEPPSLASKRPTGRAASIKCLLTGSARSCRVVAAEVSATLQASGNSPSSPCTVVFEPHLRH